MNTNFTLDVNIHLPAAVLDFLERLSTGHAVSGPAVQAASVPAPVPVTPVPVAQPAAAPAPVAQPVPAPAPAAAPPTARAFRFEDIQLAATSLCDTGKRAEVLALLAKYGIQALSALPAEQYGAFATELRGLGAKI